MTGAVVPLGRYVGVLPGPPVDGRPGPHHTVRLTGRRVVLSSDAMLVWALAHGIPGSPDLRRWDLAAMARHAPPGATDLGPPTDRLRAAGLLAWAPDPGEPADVERFARGVRLFPMAVGLGNSAARPRAFTVGRPGSPVATLAPGAFHLWSWACLAPDLWSACAGAAGSVGFTAAGAAHELLRDLLDALPDLLATNAAHLDAVPGAAR